MQSIKEYVENRKALYRQQDLSGIKMALVQVGHVPASDRYVRNKMRDLEDVGIQCDLISLPEAISESALIDIVEALNKTSDVTGYLIQLPLPAHINVENVMAKVDPAKDVDGFHELSKTVPATPLGVYNYLLDQKFEFTGKNAVVIGRSNIVGKPMANLLLKEDMTVTICHSKTPEATKRALLETADLIVIATGYRGTVHSGYLLKPSAVVIDVGINVDENGKLQGDCEPGLPVAFQTPVPGGVGLLTRLSVIDNLIFLHEQQKNQLN